MSKKPIYTWDEESGIATCEIKYKETSFLGTAHCHPEDRDMIGEKTGCTIAMYRAEIKNLQYIKNFELRPALSILQHLYGTMKNSKNFNPKSYENKMLQRQIRLKEDELVVVSEAIIREQQILKQYIDDKEKCFKHLRFNKTHPRVEDKKD